MKLNLKGLSNKKQWVDANINLPNFNIENIVEETQKDPNWLHFGAGNIFRIFIGSICDQLIETSEINKGIICAETFDFDIIDKIYKPFDNLTLGVTLKSDGKTEKRVIASITEAVKASSDFEEDYKRLKEVFTNKNLQVCSFTITEKGYALKDADDNYLPFVTADIENGPKNPRSTMGIVCSLLNERYKANKSPIAMVSLDNCSHNGEKLMKSIVTIAEEWLKENFVDRGFIDYLTNHSVSFPWTMIDKITPRPADIVAEELKKLGVENMDTIITSKGTYTAPFVNAEGPQYLVIEDDFPNGRPPFEKAGVYMTDRDTVNKVERMKVTTCLNPLHTALAVYGCILDYNLIANEMKDAELRKLVENIGIVEGMPVVTNPGIILPEKFVDEVINVRMTNPFMPDAPQRIATDTSQKVGIRYGETIKSYVAKYGNANCLTFIPLAIAGWCRYLLGVNDNGEKFELSADPMADELTKQLEGIVLGKPETYSGQLKPILSNANVFGINLYEAGIGEKIEGMFVELIEGKGAVRKTLQKYTA